MREVSSRQNGPKPGNVIAELMHRHFLAELDLDTLRQIDEIYRAGGPDAEGQLLAIAEHQKIDGSQTERYATEALRFQQLVLNAPSNAARKVLTRYRKQYGKMYPDAWLEHFDRVHAIAIDTFPTERQERALRDYRQHCVEGQASQAIAAHTIALELWAMHRRADTGRPFGAMLEAACRAVGLRIDDLRHTAGTLDAKGSDGDGHDVTATDRESAAPRQEALL